MSRISFGTLHSGLYENVNPKNNQGALKRQLLIPCDLYNNISRCLNSEGGYIFVKGACKETNMILILSIINI